jgi:two-component system cell cycle response regulator
LERIRERRASRVGWVGCASLMEASAALEGAHGASLLVCSPASERAASSERPASGSKNRSVTLLVDRLRSSGEFGNTHFNVEDERTTNPNKTVVTVIAQAPKKADTRDACLVVIYGDDLGRRIPLGNEPCVIGRSSKCEVQIDQESVSRNHARLTRGSSGYSVRDLGSTNGTYVNDEIIDEVMLRDGDQVKVGRTIFKFIVGGNIESVYYEEIYRLMTVDGLTDLHNKRYFTEAMEKEISRGKRYERTFSLIMFDIDHFKRINDTYGHLAGDAVLRQIGALVKSRVRHTDLPARTGGEEFAVILPEVPAQGAALLADKLRKAIEETTFRFEGTNIPVTISLGVAEWNPAVEDPDELVKRADEKLYEAKRGGRNQVRF